MTKSKQTKMGLWQKLINKNKWVLTGTKKTIYLISRYQKRYKLRFMDMEGNWEVWYVDPKLFKKFGIFGFGERAISPTLYTKEEAEKFVIDWTKKHPQGLFSLKEL